MRLALRVTPLAAASTQDVTFVSANQRYGFMLNVDVTAVDGNLDLLGIDCTGQRGPNRFDLQALASLYGVASGQTYTAQKPVTVVAESPLQNLPLRISCSADARDTSGAPLVSPDEFMELYLDAPFILGWGAAEGFDRCLKDCRFSVDVFYSLPAGPRRQATVMTRSDDRLSFFYEDPRQLELLVQVIDQCQAQNRYWVFIGGPTPLRSEIVISDQATGARRNYLNPMNQDARELRDTEGFRCR
jgi:hypothetical protein